MSSLVRRKGELPPVGVTVRVYITNSDSNSNKRVMAIRFAYDRSELLDILQELSSGYGRHFRYFKNDISTEFFGLAEAFAYLPSPEVDMEAFATYIRLEESLRKIK